MKKLLFTTLLILVTSLPLEAAIFTKATAELDWGQLAGSINDVNITSQLTFAQAGTNPPVNITSFGNINESFSMNQILATAQTSLATIYASSEATADSNVMKSTDSTAGRNFRFTANQTGTLSFSLPYKITLLETQDSPATSGDGFASVFLTLQNLSDSSATGSGFAQDFLQAQAPNYSFASDGTLLVSKNFSAGDMGRFSAIAVTAIETGKEGDPGSSAVPEPFTLALLGIGLAGVAAQKKH